MADHASAMRLHEQGLVANEAGDTRKARDLFLHAINICPDHVPSILSAANMLLKLNEPRGALKLYQSLSTLDMSSDQRRMLKEKLAVTKARVQETLGHPSTTNPHDAAAAAELYKEAKSPDLSPLLRESKLTKAICLWDGCEASPTIQANLGKAHSLLAELSIEAPTDRSSFRREEFILEPTKRAEHYSQTVKHFSAACNAGRVDLMRPCVDAFESLVRVLSDKELDQKLRLEMLVDRLPKALQQPAVLKIADVAYKHGVKALSKGEWREALRAFRESERPLTRAQQLRTASSGSDADWARQLKEEGLEVEALRESITLHLLIAEGRQAVSAGDVLLNAAMKHAEEADQMIDGVWQALDKYSEAALLGRDRDIETEAIAVARRGKIYAKVFRNETLARPLLLHAIELTISLTPRTFHGVPWYDECQRQLQSYQEEEFNLESRAADRRRQAELQSLQPILEKMKPQLDALNKFSDTHNVYQLLEHVYDKHPPKVDAFLRKREKVLKDVKGANADTLKRILVQSSQLHYHPDKNPGRVYGDEWYVLSMEISKLLNARYNQIK